MSLAIKAARARGGTLNGARYGDPGLFGFLGKVAKGVVGGAVGLATGGLSGAISGAVSPFVGVRPSAMQTVPLALPPGPGFAAGGGGGVAIQPVPGVGGAVQRLLPGGASGFQAVACPKGFHANKAAYFLRDGTFVDVGMRCVKNRRRNPLNPRALRRAVGRVDAGKTWQGKLHEIETSRYTKAGNRKD